MAKKIDVAAEAAETEAKFLGWVQGTQELADAMERDLEGLDDEARQQYYDDLAKLHEQE